MKLQTHYVEKPWGRTELPSVFGSTGGRRIGEVWFEGPKELELPLLLKYIFTSEKLSIQVHPNDSEARERGLPQGKSECWYILDSEPGATLGLGLQEELSAERLREAALDGSIEDLMDWKPVRRGDFFFVPSGTVHAIGAGISLLEFQQNADVTYRLYDYGRPRELHLEDGTAVSKAGAYPDELAQHVGTGEEKVLVDGPHFTLLQTAGASAAADRLSDRRRWLIPLSGRVEADGEEAGPGECLLVEAGQEYRSSDAVLLIGAAGALDG